MRRVDDPTSIDAAQVQLGQVSRARLARYLELPSAAQIDPITDEEIRKLDARRDELLSFSQRAVLLRVDAIEEARVYLHRIGSVETTDGFTSELRSAGADAVIISAFTLGQRIDDEITRHLDRQDVYEAFVLKQWAATMAEQARVAVTNHLRSWADSAGRSLLPFSGPGYNGWPLTTLRPLLEIVYRGAQLCEQQPIRATDYGVLLPTNSMLIVHGLTPRRVRAPRRESLAQCHRCTMRDCRYRVAPSPEMACSSG